MSGMRAVEPWVVGPLERFVAESGARLTLLITPSGQVLAQHGFTRAVDVMAAAALGAGIAASTGEISRMVEGTPFRRLNHQGERHGIFMGAFMLPRGPYLALVIYGQDALMGVVQLFFEELVAELAAAAPVPEPAKAVLAADFERDLNESLATLFRQ